MNRDEISHNTSLVYYMVTFIIAGSAFLLSYVSPYFTALLFSLIAAHWIADYPLQGDWLSKCKKDGPLPVYHVMAHSGIQGFFVMLITGSSLLGVGEWAVHAITDRIRVNGEVSYGMDQAIHILCKVGWAILIYLDFVHFGHASPFIALLFPGVLS